MKRLIKVLLMVLVGFSSTAPAQLLKMREISINDSIKIKNEIEGFYSWYGTLIKRNRLAQDFSPAFVMDKNSMTTLDFTKYSAGLKKHDFSDDFIKRRVNNYKPCLDNLKNIPYNTFIEFEELDQFEEIKCDFSNRNEWGGGMEPFDGAELVTLNKIDKQTIESKIRFFKSSPDGVKHYWGAAIVILRQFRSGWMIDDLK